MNVQQSLSLEGRVAIVTGAAGLLGKQHCFALAEAGAHVVVSDLVHASCETLVHEFQKRSLPAAMAIEADITQPDSIQRLRDQCLAQFGRIDILVNNAAMNDAVEGTAYASHARFEQYPLELWKRVLDVNVTGTFICSQILGQVMAQVGKGSIINIASTYGVVAPDQSLYRKEDGSQDFFKSPVYPTSKGAVLAFTRFLAAYWGASGVRVNALSPGGVENNQDPLFITQYKSRTPLGRMASPSDYQGAILFLASDASSYMTGANLVVDGGWTIW